MTLFFCTVILIHVAHLSNAQTIVRLFMEKINCNFFKKISRATKWLWLILILCICILLLFVFFQGGGREGVNQTEKSEATRGLISLSQISGIQDVYSVASSLTPPSPTQGPSPQGGGEAEEVKAAIFPHHTLIAPQLAEYWQVLAKTNPSPSVIVIIGAAHDNQGLAMLQTTTVDYQTDFGVVKTSDEITSALISDGVAEDEPASFDNEHSIGTQILFAAKLFPETPVVPIIVKSTAGINEARAFISSLNKNLPAEALVIFSLDFSHGLTAAAAWENDAALQIMMAAGDYSQIDVLNEKFLDSPFTLDAWLLWLKEKNLDKELIWHSHSGEVTRAATEPGTSYLIFFATPHEEALTITAVGDIMLSRAVGAKLKTVSLDAAFSQAADVLLDSDLVFANLESVLSTSTVESSKEIRFKADPARIDVLNYFGLTHVSVTNNHIGDYGRAAWEESIDYLNVGGVIPIGGYGNNGVPVFVEADDKKIAFLAFDTTIWKIDAETIENVVGPLKDQADVVVVSFHWGNEYQHQPTNQQVAIAQATIDAGADLVLGHHPHVLETIEKYHNGLILYSLGNFIFDQFGFDENESLVAKIFWTEKTKKLELVPMRIDGYFPRPATEEEKNKTLDRLAEWSDPGLQEEIKSGEVKW